MIRIKTERATVSQEFKDAVLALAVERLKQIREGIEYQTGYQAVMRKKQLAPAIVRLGKLIKNPEEGMDEIVTRLRGLPYTEYSVISHPGHDNIKFLCGTTKDVHIRYGITTYNMGSYSVRIPFWKIIGSKWPRDIFGVDWHFIPLLKCSPESEYHHSDYRHPHHCGQWGYSSSTCWGDFNSMIFDLLDQCDIPELFRTIYIYLTRYDSHSVLRGRVEDGYFPWAKLVRAGAS